MPNWKDLVFQKDETEQDSNQSSQPPKQKAVSFPKTEFPKDAVATGFDFNFQTNSTPAPEPVASTPSSITTGNIPKEVIEGIELMYQQGFDSLNQAGYDFYEFSKAIQQAGVDNPEMYRMAYTMAKAMDQSITKERLIQSADFYIGKILEAYQNFATQGEGKLQNVQNQKHNERSSLEGELQNLQEQLNAVQVQINDRKQKLGQIDTKYIQIITETQSKINANNSVKDKFVNVLNKIKSGITNNLK